MRIAQVAPLAESVPPRGYGGTERIVSYLTEELVRQGHDVTLFASGDSITMAELVPCAKSALRLDAEIRDAVPYHILMLEQVRRRWKQFDVVHFHIDLLQFPMISMLGVPTVTTLHGRLDLPDLVPFYRVFTDVPLISISDAQRKPIANANWIRTIHHGLPLNLLPFCPAGSQGYLAFMGRISPEKRPDLAIEIAARAGLPLKIAAKVDKVDADYWSEVIEPLVRRHPNVEYIGEIDDSQKAAFLGGAIALLFPIDWPEPFGLVMIEAMACGTPVVAFPRGSVPEIIDHGVTGMIVHSVEEAVDAVERAARFNRPTVRAVFERRFSAERMAWEYVEAFESLRRNDLSPAERFLNAATPPMTA